jgi:predicted MFS family arabinose efflux permease
VTGGESSPDVPVARSSLSRSRKLQILAVLALTNLVSYAARNALVVVFRDLDARFGINNLQFGLLQTAFILPHAAATLPFGWAGDRYDRRRVIVVGVVVASLAGAAGALGHSYWGLAASRACVGVGTAAVVPVANSILGQIFEGPLKASRLSIFNLGLFLGGVTGFAAGFALGFPAVVVALAAPGLVLAAWIAVSPVPLHPMPTRVLSWWRYLAQFFSDARTLIGIRTLRRVILATTLMAFATQGSAVFLEQFLTRDKHMAKGDVFLLMTLGLCGGVGGVLAGGRVADRLRRRRVNGRLWTIALGMTLTIPCAALAIELPDGPALYVAVVATLFFISWYHAPMAATVDDLAPFGRSVAAQSLVIFTMHMFGTAPASAVMGEVSDLWDVRIAMWVPAVALGAAALATAAAATSFAEDYARARASAPAS